MTTFLRSFFVPLVSPLVFPFAFVALLAVLLLATACASNKDGRGGGSNKIPKSPCACLEVPQNPDAARSLEKILQQGDA